MVQMAGNSDCYWLKHECIQNIATFTFTGKVGTEKNNKETKKILDGHPGAQQYHTIDKKQHS